MDEQQADFYSAVRGVFNDFVLDGELGDIEAYMLAVKMVLDAFFEQEEGKDER